MAHGYKLVGKSIRFDTDYIPSLIGCGADQTLPSPDDLYYERFDCSVACGQITSVEATKYVNYDSTPHDRDPILAVSGTGIAFYITASELNELASEIGDTDLSARLAAALRRVKVNEA